MVGWAHVSISEYAVVAQLVEHVIGNDEVSGSSPDNGSILRAVKLGRSRAKVAQLVEHFIRNERVAGSIPAFGS